MIVIKVWGGLGNQLFQYAFGYALARNNNDDLYLDISFYKNHQFSYVGRREFELNILDRDITIIDKLPSSIKALESFFINRVLHRIHASITISFGKVFFVKEAKRFYMEDIPYTKESLNYYDGYWQSGLYFQAYKDILREKMIPSVALPKQIDRLLYQIKREDNSTSVHIRKGDFNGLIGQPVEKSFYHRAIEYIKERVEHPIFFVFSDDLQWVKDNLDFGDHVRYQEYSGSNAAVFDLFCMAQCKHGIMSASTFSWWGNWLKEPGGIIIAPKGMYFNNCFLEDEWIKL